MTAISPARSGIGIGLHALGIGTGSRPNVLASVARRADEVGFATLWCGEHVVMVDEPSSRYPYSDDGKIAVPADADWLDPLLALSFAAACTTSITLATGILLLPEHTPLVVAKQAATLDVLSGGRFALGIGIGWSAEEFAALGVPFARRAARTAEYVAAIRQAWTADSATFDGEFVHFERVRVNPKPVRGRMLPVIVGGNTDASLSRVAAFGDGWYGFNIASSAIPERLGVLAKQCDRHDRDPRSLSIAVSVSDSEPEIVAELASLGVTEVVIAGAPPAEPDEAADWVSSLAAKWLNGGTAPTAR